MNTIQLREQIEETLLEISPENLKIIAEFVEFVKDKQAKNQSSLEAINYKPASGRSILRHAGTSVGDDLEDCLKLLYETRGKIKIDNRLNPFE